MTSAVTGLYPWTGFKASERMTVWTVAGYGAGGLMLQTTLLEGLQLKLEDIFAS